MARCGRQALTLALLAVAGLAARDQADGAAAQRHPVGVLVVDAAGAVVGRLHELAFSQGRVVMEAGGLAVTVVVDGQGFRGASNRVVFESGDCSGPAFIYSGGTFPAEPGLFPYTGLLGTRLLIEDGPTQVANVASGINVPTGLCEGLALGLSDVRPSRDLADLSHFVPPFTLR
jgi:hypothetical protein